MMSSGCAFQMNGCGLAALYSRTKRLMAAWRSTREWKIPCLSLRRVSLAKKPSTALSHEHEVGVKWKVEAAWMTVEPGADLVLLVRRVIVEDHVDGLVRRHLALDAVEEADELLMAVALHVLPDDRSIQNVERREQRGRAVAFVVMGHGAGAALLHRQAGLGAVECLDLRLLVDRQHHRMGRWIDIRRRYRRASRRRPGRSRA